MDRPPRHGALTDGVRSALVIASDAYADPKLRQLRAPARDAAELARVLRDPEVGAFDVEVSANEPEHVVRRKLAAFFQDRGLNDLLLLHLSCHGVKDDDGRLYFATADTELEHLDATAIPSDFVNRQMTRSRSRRVLLLLDCCYSGAFASGLIARGGSKVDVRERFEGRGRVVLTASSAMEYAFEGDELSGAPNPSVFTSALVRGLETGAADWNGDGWVSVDELYDYAFDEVRKLTPSQTPGKWTFDVQGDLYVARSSSTPLAEEPELPAELVSATQSPFAHVRAGAVEELARLLQGPDDRLANAAREALGPLVDDDSRRVSERAAQALAEPSPAQAARIQPVRATHALSPSTAVEAPPHSAAHGALALTKSMRAPLVAAVLALAGAAAVLLSFVLPIAEGKSVLAYARHHSEWGVFFVYSPIELILGALGAAVLGFALLRSRIQAALAGGVLSAVGLLLAASSVALREFFGVDAAPNLVSIVGAILFVASGALLVSSSRRAPRGIHDIRTVALAIVGAVLVFVSVFVEFELGSSMAGVGLEYSLEPLVAVGSIGAALVLATVLVRPLIAGGLLVAVGVLTALHDIGVIVAAVGGESPARTAGFIGLVGGVLAAAAGARLCRGALSTGQG
jgi:caspase domain-containing protein